MAQIIELNVTQIKINDVSRYCSWFSWPPCS
jgi:hypothetical protein